MILTDEEIETCRKQAGISYRRHMSSVRGQMITELDDPEYHLIAAIEAAVMAKFEVVAHVERPLGGGANDVITDFLPPGTPLYALKEEK